MYVAPYSSISTIILLLREGRALLCWGSGEGLFWLEGTSSSSAGPAAWLASSSMSAAAAAWDCGLPTLPPAESLSSSCLHSCTFLLVAVTSPLHLSISATMTASCSILFSFLLSPCTASSLPPRATLSCVILSGHLALVPTSTPSASTIVPSKLKQVGTSHLRSRRQHLK